MNDHCCFGRRCPRRPRFPNHSAGSVWARQVVVRAGNTTSCSSLSLARPLSGVDPKELASDGCSTGSARSLRGGRSPRDGRRTGDRGVAACGVAAAHEGAAARGVAAAGEVGAVAASHGLAAVRGVAEAHAAVAAHAVAAGSAVSGAHGVHSPWGSRSPEIGRSPKGGRTPSPRRRPHVVRCLCGGSRPWGGGLVSDGRLQPMWCVCVCAAQGLTAAGVLPLVTCIPGSRRRAGPLPIPRPRKASGAQGLVAGRFRWRISRQLRRPSPARCAVARHVWPACHSLAPEAAPWWPPGALRRAELLGIGRVKVLRFRDEAAHVIWRTMSFRLGYMMAASATEDPHEGSSKWPEM